MNSAAGYPDLTNVTRLRNKTLQFAPWNASHARKRNIRLRDNRCMAFPEASN